MVQHFTQASFEEALQNNPLVLVDFWATWCGPCRMMAPVIEELAADYDGKVVVGKVDVDEEGALAQQFGIMSIPTIMLFKNGKAVGQAVGARPKAAIAGLIDQNL